MDTEEKLTGIEAFLFDTAMGVAIVLGWLLAAGSYLLQPERKQTLQHDWNSRKDFRQSGLQPQSRDVSGMVIAGITLVLIAVTLIALYPRPL